MKKDIFDLLAHAKFWGTKRIRAPSETPPARTLEVFLQPAEPTSLIGRLSCEQGEYVFRYEPSYEGAPISAFPNMEQVYRSKNLWPFFATRIPPLDREDVRNAINERELREDQTIEILGSVARVSVANPYEFKLAGG